MRRLLARLGVRHGYHISVARDFSIYSSVNIVSLVLLLGTAVVLRRYLGPLLAGIWITLEVLPNYAQYAHLGVLNSAERDLPYLLGARRIEEFDRRKHTLFWLTHGLGALLAVTLAAGALLFRSRIATPQLFVGLLVYAPLVWLQILAAYYVVLFRARKRFVILSTRQGISNLTKAGLTMAGGYLFGLYGVFAALLTAGIVQVALFHSALDERFARVFDRRILWPMIVAGLPMLAGGVAFETIRNADRFVILRVFGLETLGVYSVVPIICQGVFYFPNTLSLVMFPRFQERYGETQDPESLRRFIEIPLHVLGDSLLAAIAVLFVALPPALTAFLPDYTASITPLRYMLLGTYFLCLSPPAGQFLITIHKQVQVLSFVVPSMALALAAAYVGASRGLVGVTAGIVLACLVHFVGINVYAFSCLGGAVGAARPLAEVGVKAVVVLAVVGLIDRFVPAGPTVIAVVGGWRLLAVVIVTLPLLLNAVRRVRTLSAGFVR